jgi:hypothetical protein
MKRILIGGLCLPILLYSAYWVKCKLNINFNLLGGEHLPCQIERWTGGLLKCEWFPNSQHCQPHQD